MQLDRYVNMAIDNFSVTPLQAESAEDAKILVAE